jgi:hypothetical protein
MLENTGSKLCFHYDARGDRLEISWDDGILLDGNGSTS